MTLISTTREKCWIVSLEEGGRRLAIQYVPNEFLWTRKPAISEVQIVGRNVPKHHYTGGKKELKFELDFYSVVEERDDVIEKVRWLESLTYNDGPSADIERVKVIFGTLYKDEVWVIQDVESNIQFFEKENFLPQQAFVNLTLLLDAASTINPNFDVRKSDVIL